jgi:cytidylate kinase
MIITIDGPAGAGKSSTARALARVLGFDFLDTGAMYRAVTLALLRAGISPKDETAVSRVLTSLHLEMPADRVLLNGEDVSLAIRASEVTAASGAVADSPEVRRHLGRLQRQIAAGRNIVTEGRDQGTIVFPDAECKFFMVADPQERARRRYEELRQRGERFTLAEVLQQQAERDRRDAARDLAPMVPAADAITIDSTSLTPAQAVARMEEIVRQWQPGGATSGTSSSFGPAPS